MGVRIYILLNYLQTHYYVINPHKHCEPIKYNHIKSVGIYRRKERTQCINLQAHLLTVFFYIQHAFTNMQLYNLALTNAYCLYQLYVYADIE